MNELSFGHEQYLYYLFVLPILCLVMIAARYVEKKKISSLGEGVARHLAFRWSLPRFVLRTALFTIGFGCLIFAAAKPRWGYTVKEVSQYGSDIMVLFDVSRSMNATDISPSRMSRAKRKLLDIIAGLKGERLGIVAFAGRAFVHCPLSDDKAMLGLFVDSLADDLISYQGTNLSEAARIAIQSLDAAQAKDSAGKKLVIITDGEDFSGEIAGLRKLIEDKNIEIAIMGIGTPEGSPVKLSDGSLLKDQNGSVVISKLAEKELIGLAESVGGLYVRSVASDRDVEAILKTIIGRDETETKNQEKVWNEIFQVFIFVGFLCLILGFLITPYLALNSIVAILLAASTIGTLRAFSGQLMRLSFILFVIVLGLNSFPLRVYGESPSLASPRPFYNESIANHYPRGGFVKVKTVGNSTLAGSKNSSVNTDKESHGAKEKTSESQSPERLFRNKQFGEAAAAFEAQASGLEPNSNAQFQGLYNAAVAHYEAMHYDEAIAGFKKAAESSSKELRRDAFFNLANTFVAKGELEQSLAFYKSSMEIDSSFQEAKENLQWVMEQLEEQKKQNKQDADTSQSSEYKDGSEKKDDLEKNQNDQEQSGNNLGGKPEGQKNGQNGPDTSGQAGNQNSNQNSDQQTAGSHSKNRSNEKNQNTIGAGSGGSSDKESEEKNAQKNASAAGTEKKSQQPQGTPDDGSALSGVNKGKQNQENDQPGSSTGRGVQESKHENERQRGSVTMGPGKSDTPKGSSEANAILRQVDENLKVWGIKPRFENQNNNEKDW